MYKGRNTINDYIELLKNNDDFLLDIFWSYILYKKQWYSIEAKRFIEFNQLSNEHIANIITMLLRFNTPQTLQIASELLLIIEGRGKTLKMSLYDNCMPEVFDK